MSLENQDKIQLRIQDCPISSVTVYRDRAEIIRTISFLPDRLGEIQIQLDSLTKQADPESIRLSGIGPCKIVEVSHEKVSSLNSANNDTIAEKMAIIKELKKRKKTIEMNISRLNKKRNLVDKYTNNILAPSSSIPPTSLEIAKSVIEFNSIESENFDKEELELTEQLENIQQEIRLADLELTKVQGDSMLQNIRWSYTVFVIVDVKEREVLVNRAGVPVALGTKACKNTFYCSRVLGVESIPESDGTCGPSNGPQCSDCSGLTSTSPPTTRIASPLTLQIKYVVRNATWQASYDVRVVNEDNSFALSYFAEVTQSTGEDWKNCHLFLSTSNPALGGGSPPQLETKVVSIAHKYQEAKKSRYSIMEREEDDECLSRERAESISLLDDAGPGSLPTIRGYFGRQQNGENQMLADVKGSGDAGSTIFTIPRNVNIECDGKPHKVTITVESFVPQMVHYVVPSLSPHVYIQSKTQNLSPYPLLPSEKVSVFLDGNFISTSAIKQTGCGEFFTLFLGVDPSVKVEVLPSSTEHSSKGWMRGNVEINKYFHSTLLHNTKDRPVKIIIAQSLPRSENEKITVELMEPPPASLKKSEGGGGGVESHMIASAQDIISTLEPEGESNSTAWPADFVYLNKPLSNLIWLKTIPPANKIEVKFHYKVQWPTGSQIEIR